MGQVTQLVMISCATCSGQFSWDVGDPLRVRCLKGLADICGVAKLAAECGAEKFPKTLPTIQNCLEMAQKAQDSAPPQVDIEGTDDK